MNLLLYLYSLVGLLYVMVSSAWAVDQTDSLFMTHDGILEILLKKMMASYTTGKLTCAMLHHAHCN